MSDLPSEVTAAQGHVQVKDFHISFKAGTQVIQAVNGVSMDVKPGEFVSLIGPSGCGKSTLLNAVAGFIKPSSGEVTLDGRAIDGPGPERGVGASEREARARTFLGLTGLLAFENHYPEQLSGGMKQRVGIVRALATSPQVVLMDEPFGALDSQTRVVMQEILTNMWQQLRLSVLFVTHDIDEALFLSDRIYVMTSRPGRIKAELVVPLARPRRAEMMSSPQFTAMAQEIRALIREESLAAMGHELQDGGLEGLSTHIGPKVSAVI